MIIINCEKGLKRLLNYFFLIVLTSFNEIFAIHD